MVKSTALQTRVAIRVETGIKRNYLEDSAVVIASSSPNHNRTLLIVADGMGGWQGGEFVGKIANQLVIDTIQQELMDLFQSNQLDERESPDFRPEYIDWETYLIERLQQAIIKTNAVLHNYVQQKRKTVKDFELVTSTLTCVLIQDDLAIIAALGDCRTYLFCESELELITDNWPLKLGGPPIIRFDYGLPLGAGLEVQINLAQGGRSFEIEDQHKFLSTVQLYLWSRSLKPLDWLLLCSDGLWSLVEEKIITQILREADSIETAVNLLIETANDQGAPDNIAVIICEMTAAN